MKRQLLFITLFLSLAASAQKADSIKLKNATLYYYTYGSGEPIIILSGGPGISSHQEDDLAIALSKKYRAILFDQRGTGKSWTVPFDSSTINVATAISDIEALRKHLHIKQLVISGHSWGAMLASAYTAKYPDNVKNLILIGGGEISTEMSDIVNESVDVRFQLGDTTAFYYWNDSVNIKREPEKARYENRKISWSMLTYDRSKVDRVLEQAEHGEYNKEMNRLMWKSLNSKYYSRIETLRQGYKNKCLIIFGWQDPIAVTTLSSYIKAYPRATVKGINKCGHMLSVEQPEEFFKAVFDYLKSSK